MTILKVVQKWFLMPLIIILCCVSQSAGQEYMTESGHAEFESSVPLHSFTGKSDHLVGKITLNDSIVDFYLDVTTLKTGNGKRDKDMLETLEAEEYPFAEFYGKLAGYDSDANGTQAVTAEGEFTIHGVSRELSIDGTLEETDEGLQLSSSWMLNMEDYDIEPPGILFYRVSEEVNIQIEATLKPTGE